MRISNGNFLDEDGNEVNLVELLRTGKATPVVNNNDGHHMSAHSGWFTDENGIPVNIIALIDAAIDEGGGSDQPAIGGISVNGGNVVTPDENGIINLTISGDGSTVIDSELSASSTNPVQNKIITGEIEDLNEAVDSLNGSLNYNAKAIKDNLSQTYGKNLFNPLRLIADGITNENGESYGASKAFADNIGTIPFVIPTGTQFTVSFDAYVEPVSGTSGSGLVFKILRADGTTLSQQIAIPNNTSEWTSFQMTPNANFGANGIEFVVSARGTNITHIRNIQIEYGSTKTEYENPLTARDKKSETRLSVAEESIIEIEENLENIKDSIIKDGHSDILYGKTVEFRKFCDPSTGEIRTLSFYSVLGIEIPKDAVRLYPYNENDATNHALRSVVFYSSAEVQDVTTFISGQSGTSTNVNNGIAIPSGAVSCAVTIGNTAITSPNYYLSTTRGGDVVTPYLKEGILVKAEQIVDLPKGTTNAPVQLPNRKPTFAFIFDDGTDGDVNVKALFDSYGFKCGFALLGAASYLSTRRERYLSYQDEGFEILSHSVTGDAFSSITDLTTAEQYLRESKTTLKSAGFDVRGWVTPSTTLLEAQMPLVEKYYQYGYGHLQNTAENPKYHSFIGKDIRQLERWGLEGNTVSDTLAKIDEAIAHNAYMVFYGHSYPSTTNNMTEENMATILTYLKTKSDNGEIMVGTPNETINNYYAFRHSDLLDVYNRINA